VTPASCSRRAGFALAEVIVAAVLLAVGMLGLAAAASFARDQLRQAENGERLTRAVSMLIDSIRASGRHGDGTLDADGMRLEWSVDGAGRMTVRARLADTTAGGTRVYETRLEHRP
jgi:Tfp pilus assembly protein PilV